MWQGMPKHWESAVQVDIGTGLIVNVASIPALAALKLLAWNDRGLIDGKDAQDLFFLLKHYHEAGNIDRLYDEAFALLEGCGHDVELAGAALLGYDTKLIVEDMARPTAADPAIPSSFIQKFERGLGLATL